MALSHLIKGSPCFSVICDRIAKPKPMNYSYIYSVPKIKCAFFNVDYFKN